MVGVAAAAEEGTETDEVEETSAVAPDAEGEGEEEAKGRGSSGCVVMLTIEPRSMQPRAVRPALVL